MKSVNLSKETKRKFWQPLFSLFLILNIFNLLLIPGSNISQTFLKTFLWHFVMSFNYENAQAFNKSRSILSLAFWRALLINFVCMFVNRMFPSINVYRKYFLTLKISYSWCVLPIKKRTPRFPHPPIYGAWVSLTKV
jgi:hypothetical protein